MFALVVQGARLCGIYLFTICITVDDLVLVPVTIIEEESILRINSYGL